MSELTSSVRPRLIKLGLDVTAITAILSCAATVGYQTTRTGFSWEFKPEELLPFLLPLAVGVALSLPIAAWMAMRISTVLDKALEERAKELDLALHVAEEDRSS